MIISSMNSGLLEAIIYVATLNEFLFVLTHTYCPIKAKFGISDLHIFLVLGKSSNRKPYFSHGRQ